MEVSPKDLSTRVQPKSCAYIQRDPDKTRPVSLNAFGLEYLFNPNVSLLLHRFHENPTEFDAHVKHFSAGVVLEVSLETI